MPASLAPGERADNARLWMPGNALELPETPEEGVFSQLPASPAEVLKLLPYQRKRVVTVIGTLCKALPTLVTLSGEDCWRPQSCAS